VIFAEKPVAALVVQVDDGCSPRIILIHIIKDFCSLYKGCEMFRGLEERQGIILYLSIFGTTSQSSTFWMCYWHIMDNHSSWRKYPTLVNRMMFNGIIRVFV